MAALLFSPSSRSCIILNWRSNTEQTLQSRADVSIRSLEKVPEVSEVSFRSFVLACARRYPTLEFLLSCWICNEEDPDQLGSAELVPVGAGTGMKSMVFKWTSPTLQQARRFLETTLAIPPVVRTDERDNVWSFSLSHLPPLMWVLGVF